MHEEDHSYQYVLWAFSTVVPFHSIPFHSIPFSGSIQCIGSIPFSAVVPFHSLQWFQSIQWFHFVLFNFKISSSKCICYFRCFAVQRRGLWGLVVVHLLYMLNGRAWLHKPGVLGLIARACLPFHFPLCFPQNIKILFIWKWGKSPEQAYAVLFLRYALYFSDVASCPYWLYGFTKGSTYNIQNYVQCHQHNLHINLVVLLWTSVFVQFNVLQLNCSVSYIPQTEQHESERWRLFRICWMLPHRNPIITSTHSTLCYSSSKILLLTNITITNSIHPRM